jgi:hypothetical protein
VLAERGIGDEPFQPAVFFFELPEPLQFAHPQMGVFFLPGVERGVTHPQLPAEVADGGAGVCLSDRAHNLFLGKLRPLHGSAPFVRTAEAVMLL